jgi:radical SAM superfamily enzyme YgiQ (UPF0313 family)
MNIDLLLISDTAETIFQRTIGPYQVAHHARKNGFTAQVIDFASMFDPEEIESLVLQCIGDNTLAIGVSTTFLNYERKRTKISAISNDSGLPEDIANLLSSIKTKYPTIKIIAGGANSYHIKNNSLVDVVLHGYSEQSLVDYLISLRTGRKKIFPKLNGLTVIDGTSEHFDIENLDHFWDKNDCVLPKETLPIEISRGCIFSCKFCAYPLNGKKKFDYIRDPERIRDELIKNYELYGTTNYYFTDDTFNDSTYKLERLHKVITQLPFKINFITFLRMDLLYAHPEQIKLLYEMGLASAHFGIETLNPASGKVVGKGMNPDKLKEFMVELHDVHWKKEINYTCSFIIGLPGETLESVQESYDWCKTAPFTCYWFPLWIKKSGPYKSDFDLNYEKHGYIVGEQNSFSPGTKIRNGSEIIFSDTFYHWENEHMNSEIAAEYAKKFNDEGYYKNEKITGWNLLSLLNYGYTLEEARTMSMNNISIKSLIKKKKQMFEQYKAKLLGVISAHK